MVEYTGISLGAVVDRLSARESMSGEWVGLKFSWELDISTFSVSVGPTIITSGSYSKAPNVVRQ